MMEKIIQWVLLAQHFTLLVSSYLIDVIGFTYSNLLAGGSDDWAKGKLKLKYSYTIELRDEGKIMHM